MNHDITPSGPQQPEDRHQKLRQLAELANQAHHHFRESMRQAVADALQAGQALLAAKELCEDRGWTKWLKANFGPSEATARGYMRLATYWPQVGGDQERVSGLSYREIMRLIKGMECADGRANPGLKKLVAPVAPADGAITCAEVEGCEPGTLVLSPEIADEPLGVFKKLLRQAIAELRRVIEADRSEAPYARHLLQPLERIHDGLSGYQWHWDDLSPGR
jgi:hypothetical protein